MTMNKNLFKAVFFIAAITIFAACDKDYSNVGGDIIGNDHYQMTQDLSTTVTAVTKPTGPVQTNNLDVNPLGIYNNPVFGKTTASFVTQVQLASVAPSLPALNSSPTTHGAIRTRTVERVTLYIPYFSTNKGVKTGGAYNYTLDSIVNVADKDNKIKLSIYENNRYLGASETINSTSTINPFPFIFYSNNTDINNNAIAVSIGSRLNDGGLADNDLFVFDADEEIIPPTTTGGSNTYKAPGMNISLNKAFFNTKILQAQSADLATNTAFMKYFKGLYFKVEDAVGSDGCMNMLDFKKGTITIEYKETSNSTDTTLPITVVNTDKTIILNLTGNTASILQNAQALPNIPNTHTLKGGEGSVILIDLFGPQNTTTGKFQQLEDLKRKNYLINEANLTFYIYDNSIDGMGKIRINANGTTEKAIEPYRLYLYDARNKRPIADYFLDFSTSQYPNSGKVIHGGIIDPKIRTTTKRGTKYKIRLTDHIRNLVSKDSTNVTLGLSVCKTINNQFFGKQKTTANSNLNYFPNSSIMEPLGTIIWGASGTNIPAGSEMKLEIWYTKPN